MLYSGAIKHSIPGDGTIPLILKMTLYFLWVVFFFTFPYALEQSEYFDSHRMLAGEIGLSTGMLWSFCCNWCTKLV